MRQTALDAGRSHDGPTTPEHGAGPAASGEPQGSRLLRQGGDPASRFRFIEAEQDHHPIARPCRVLRVSESSYYAWRARAWPARAVTDAAVRAAIRTIHAAKYC
jgi:hypothetical protein